MSHTELTDEEYQKFCGLIYRVAGIRIGADPLGGASVRNWGAIAERPVVDVTVVTP